MASDTVAQSPGETGSIADAGGIEQSGTIEPTRALSRKVIAIIVVIIVISASTCAIWYFYFRHWSASELADRLVRSEIGGYSGYDDDLAGKSVVVEGKVTSIERYDTALGTATVVELDEVDESSLVFWSNVSYELGETISRRVHFEWAFWNDEKHVYSPEVWLQFGYALGAAAIADAVSYVGSNGGFTRVSNVDSDVRIEIGWLGEPAELGTTNCTLVSGTRSGSADVYYIYDSERA